MALNDLVVEKTDCLPSNGGTLTGPLILNADPTSNLQAATKQYVDNKIAASGNSSGWTDISNSLVLTASTGKVMEPNYMFCFYNNDICIISIAMSGANPAGTYSLSGNTIPKAKFSMRTQSGGINSNGYCNGSIYTTAGSNKITLTLGGSLGNFSQGYFIVYPIVK